MSERVRFFFVDSGSGGGPMVLEMRAGSKSDGD